MPINEYDMDQSTDIGSVLAEKPAGNARPSGVGYLSRQPILDHRGGVFGYELHCHEPFKPHGEAEVSSAAYGMWDALALFGVERLAVGAWGFVNCSLEMLVDDVFEALPPAMTVLEIPSCAEYPQRLIHFCRKLKNTGFRLALLDYEPSDERNPLMELIDYVKVEPRNLRLPHGDACARNLAASM